MHIGKSSKSKPTVVTCECGFFKSFFFVLLVVFNIYISMLILRDINIGFDAKFVHIVIKLYNKEAIIDSSP